MRPIRIRLTQDTNTLHGDRPAGYEAVFPHTEAMRLLTIGRAVVAEDESDPRAERVEVREAEVSDAQTSALLDGGGGIVDVGTPSPGIGFDDFDDDGWLRDVHETTEAPNAERPAKRSKGGRADRMVRGAVS